MLRAQALHEAETQEKERMKKKAREDNERERRRIIDQQLADRDASTQTRVLEMRQLKEQLDAEQVQASYAALCRMSPAFNTLVCLVSSVMCVHARKFVFV